MHFQTALVIPTLAIDASATWKIERSESEFDYDLKAVLLDTDVRVTNDGTTSIPTVLPLLAFPHPLQQCNSNKVET